MRRCGGLQASESTPVRPGLRGVTSSSGSASATHVLWHSLYQTDPGPPPTAHRAAPGPARPAGFPGGFGDRDLARAAGSGPTPCAPWIWPARCARRAWRPGRMSPVQNRGGSRRPTAPPGPLPGLGGHGCGVAPGSTSARVVVRNAARTGSPALVTIGRYEGAEAPCALALSTWLRYSAIKTGDSNPLCDKSGVTALPGLAPDRYRDNSSAGRREKT